jgi:hypothetical protein
MGQLSPCHPVVGTPQQKTLLPATRILGDQVLLEQGPICPNSTQVNIIADRQLNDKCWRRSFLQNSCRSRFARQMGNGKNIYDRNIWQKVTRVATLWPNRVNRGFHG